MRPPRRWLGTPAPLLTPRLFNVLAEVNALGGRRKKGAELLELCAVECRRCEDYRPLAKLASSRSEEVFGVMDTTM